MAVHGGAPREERMSDIAFRRIIPGEERTTRLTGPQPRVRLLDLRPPPTRLIDDVLHGLAQRPRILPPKYFYDRAGAQLFERIAELPEYYLTRTETALLHAHIGEIACSIGPRARIVEFGSGSGAKTRILLRHLVRPTSYTPVDIAHGQLLQFASSIAHELPHLEVLPVCADYGLDFTLPRGQREATRTVAFFPGSTIGNFEPTQAGAFLRRIRKLVGSSGGLLIGADLHKDRDVLEQAYNDRAGVTAAFNLNLLERINRECGADFDVTAFRHHALYDHVERRIEMRLIARRPSIVTVPPPVPSGVPARFVFESGDYIITEYSHKYTVDRFREMAERTGWKVSRLWLDERRWYGVWLLAADPAARG
jgi:L-histidine N-alpha-methyltransferase